MDELIGILINVIVDLFRGKPQTPPPKPVTPAGRAPVQRAPVQQRQVPPRPVRQVIKAPPAVAPRMMRAPAAPVAPPVAPPTRSISSAAPPVPSVQHSSVVVDAAALRRWLRPGVLRNQFILTEILRPPLGLRD
jgi:hypothetical protein